ncbi:NAD-dependent epimerase/dehydratase family protein [Enterococcus alishanensis]|uniref:NAD-dependent epimerase/dehydratase family protein n=1 Tax=Enterococcus alishanensis TaxID=1303817 RepID=UPI001FE692AF|nr:NAD-dependent epimerase/dehydratase family protein [Enterococcus alishanensis]
MVDNKKILITGGAGFIGSTLANFLNENNTVTVIDDLSMGKKENIDQTINFIEGSVTDQRVMKNILSKEQFDYIFHLAAIASVADSVERPIETHKVNFDSVLLLLELIREYQHNLKRLVFSSSAAVYGNEPTLPKKEESIIRPLTPYAVDKFAAEQYVLNYQHLYNVPTSAVRFFNVYGPNQNPDSPYSGVISIVVDCYKKMLANEPAEFTLFGDGQQSRDFIYVDDVVQALLLVAESAEALGTQFNVGLGKEISLNKLITVMDGLLKLQLPVKNLSEREGDIKVSVADNSKLKDLGFKEKYDVQTGLKKYLTYEKLL